MATLRSFVRGAMIMTAAAIISKLLGSIYTIILQNLIGDRGMGIYQMANPIYSTLLALTTAGFPVAISKYVSEYTALRDYRNANKIFQIALYMLAGIGLVAMMSLYFFSVNLSKIVGDPRAEWPLKAIAPALFIVPTLCGIQGYFQGWQTMRPTAISQIVEQSVRVITIIGGVLLVFFLGGKEWIAATVASFGAVTGGMAGLAVIVYELWRFRKREGHLPQRRRVHSLRVFPVLSRVEIFRKLIYYAVPVSLSALIIPLFSNVDAFTVTNLLKAHGYSQDMATQLYGLLSGRAFKLLMLPIAVISSISAALLPAVSEANVRCGENTVKKRVMLGLRFTMLLALPASVGLVLLAKPIDVALFRNDQGVHTIMWMGVATLFSGIQLNTAASLQGLGIVYSPLFSLVVGTFSKIALNLILIPQFQISGGAAATAISFGVVGIWNWVSLKKHLHLQISLKRHILRPTIAVAVMGAYVFATKIQWARMKFALPPRISAITLVLVAIVVGILVYGLMVVISEIVTKREMQAVPRLGKPLVMIFEKIGIY